MQFTPSSKEREMYERKTYRVTVTKRRTGETFTGTMQWDGLADLVAVTCDDGTVRYASSLDQIDRVLVQS